MTIDDLTDQQLLMMIDIDEKPLVLRKRRETLIGKNLERKGLAIVAGGEVTITPRGAALMLAAREEFDE